MAEELTGADGALAVFVPSTGPEDGPGIAVRTRVAAIGQAPSNDIVLDDDTVSSRHAQLEFEGDGWKLTDLESRNGTFVDGVRLAAGIPTPLPRAATVAFGAMELLFNPTPGADPASASEPEVRERVPIAERKALRLPVWLLALIVLLLAVLIALTVAYGGGAAPAVDSATETPTALLLPSTFLL